MLSSTIDTTISRKNRGLWIVYHLCGEHRKDAALVLQSLLAFAQTHSCYEIMEQGYQTGQGHYFKDILRHQKLLVPICGVYPWQKINLYLSTIEDFTSLLHIHFKKLPQRLETRQTGISYIPFLGKKTKTASLKKHNTGHLCGQHRRHTELVSNSISPFAPTRTPKMAVEVNNLRASRSLYCPKMTFLC